MPVGCMKHLSVYLWFVGIFMEVKFEVVFLYSTLLQPSLSFDSPGSLDGSPSPASSSLAKHFSYTPTRKKMTLNTTTPISTSSMSFCTKSNAAISLPNTYSLSPPTTGYDYSDDFGDDLFLDDLIGSDDSSDLDLPPFPLGSNSNVTAIRPGGVQPPSYSSDMQHSFKSAAGKSSSTVDVCNVMLPPAGRKRLFTNMGEDMVQNSIRKSTNHSDFSHSPPKKPVFHSSIRLSAMNRSNPLPPAKKFPPDCIPLSRKLSSQMQQHMTSPPTDRALGLLQPETTTLGSKYKHVSDVYTATGESRAVPEMLKSKAPHGLETHATSKASISQPKLEVPVRRSPIPAAASSPKSFRRNAARFVL